MKWQKRVARWVKDEILYANRGHWPDTVDEWETLAHRFGDHIRYNDLASEGDASFSEGVFHVPTPGIRYPITHPLYLHELAEACLQWEGRAPFLVPAKDCERNRHRIARYVERRE